MCTRLCGETVEVTVNSVQDVAISAVEELTDSIRTLGGGRIDGLYQDYIDGKKELAEVNAEYRARFVRG